MSLYVMESSILAEPSLLIKGRHIRPSYALFDNVTWEIFYLFLFFCCIFALYYYHSHAEVYRNTPPDSP